MLASRACLSEFALHATLMHRLLVGLHPFILHRRPTQFVRVATVKAMSHTRLEKQMTKFIPRSAYGMLTSQYHSHIASTRSVSVIFMSIIEPPVGDASRAAADRGTDTPHASLMRLQPVFSAIQGVINEHDAMLRQFLVDDKVGFALSFEYTPHPPPPLRLRSVRPSSSLSTTWVTRGRLSEVLGLHRCLGRPSTCLVLNAFAHSLRSFPRFVLLSHHPLTRESLSSLFLGLMRTPTLTIRRAPLRSRTGATMFSANIRSMRQWVSRLVKHFAARLGVIPGWNML